MAFDSATLAKWSSSSTVFAKQPVREMSENVRLFGLVNGAGIVNANSELFSFLLLVVPFLCFRHQYQAYDL